MKYTGPTTVAGHNITGVANSILETAEERISAVEKKLSAPPVTTELSSATPEVTKADIDEIRGHIANLNARLVEIEEHNTPTKVNELLTTMKDAICGVFSQSPAKPTAKKPKKATKTDA